jgi:hypothetical protein
MNTAREGHTATLLNDGKVIIAGGYTGQNNYTATGEIYDVVTNTWSYTDDMALGRTGHTANLFNNGKVLVVGGYAGVNNYTGIAEIWGHYPSNLFTGTLTLPSWSANPVTVTFIAATSDAPPIAGALSNDGQTWGEWIQVFIHLPLIIKD